MEKRIYQFDNLEKINGIPLENADWSRKNNARFWKINATSSYLAMFTPSLPAYFIEKYTQPGDLVMDNFSGRGTTGTVARQLNRSFVGTDLNPYSYVLTKFKINPVDKEKFSTCLKQLENKWTDKKREYCLKADSLSKSNIATYYSKQTLAMLLFLRDEIGQKWKTNNLTKNAILAVALGLMHGPIHKDGTTAFFSVSTANTISYAPNYVRKYVQTNHLVQPDVNIFWNIQKRFDKLFNPELSKDYDGKIYLSDATKSNQNIKNGSVDLVITSPPYLNIVNYTISNWVRLWLLGFELEDLKNKIRLSDKFNFANYVQFIKKYLKAIAKKLKDEAKVCIVVGDVHNQNLIESVWKQIKNDVPFQFHEIYVDEIYDERKKTTFMLNSKQGKATIVEKVLVLKKCK